MGSAGRSASEEGVRLSLPGDVFYNPEMKLCRDLSSLAVGAIGERLGVCDAFCASGVRGLRYKRENENVGRIVLVDIYAEACKAAMRNAKANGVRGARVACEGVNKFLFENSFDFLEIDPFGSPAPYLYDAVRSFRMRERGYLSVTATDVAVLCGAHAKACWKNYGAKPLDNEFCHENGVRILLGKIARTAAGFDFGVAPLFSLSHKHYMKTIVRLEAGAEKAYASMRKTGLIAYCAKCGEHTSRLGFAFGKEKCACGGKNEYAGPLWLGELHEKEAIAGMRGLNAGRDYGNKEKIAKLLATIEGEIGMPPAYYDIHRFCDRLGVGARGMEEVMGKLRAMGFRAGRTHFKPTAVKTDAAAADIARILKKHWIEAKVD